MKRLMTISIGLATGLVMGWSFLLFIPAMAEKTQLNKEIFTAEQTVLQFRQEVAMLPNILAQKEILSGEDSKLSRELYSSKQVIELLRKIGHKCDLFRLDIQEVRPPVEELIMLHQTIHTSVQPQFLNITIVLEGTFEKFGQFVTELERTPFFKGLNYSRLQSASAGEKHSQFLLEFKVLLSRSTAFRLAEK